MKETRLGTFWFLPLTAAAILVLISLFEWVDELLWPGISIEEQRFHVHLFITTACVIAALFIQRYIRVRDALQMERWKGAEKERVTSVLKEKEEKYRKLSEEFHALLAAIDDTLVLISPEMRVLWTKNGSAYHIDAPLAEITDRHCHDLYYDRDTPCEDCPVVRCFASGKREQTTGSSRTGRYLEKRAFPVFEGEKVGRVILLISDVTEKIKMQADAMQAAHMASLGELAAGVAHEINNPVNGIINYAQVLINECPAGGIERDIAERIIK